MGGRGPPGRLGSTGGRAGRDVPMPWEGANGLLPGRGVPVRRCWPALGRPPLDPGRGRGPGCPGCPGLSGLPRCGCRTAGLVRPIRTVGSRRLLGPGGGRLLARCPRHRTGPRCAGAGSRRTAVGQIADGSGCRSAALAVAEGCLWSRSWGWRRTARRGRGRRARAGRDVDSGRGRGCWGRRFCRGLRSLPGGLLRRRRFARQLLLEPAFHRRFDGRGSRSYELPHVLQHAEDGLAFDSELFRKLVDSDLCHCSPCWRSER